MTRAKAERHQAIADLIRSRAIASQEDLAERLAAGGFKVAQATVSRDLEELGALKVRRADGVRYAMPDSVPTPGLGGDRLAAIFREWVRSVEPAANLVVVKTQPGSAHLVAAALDQAGLPQIVGTVSGDDTLFVATRGVADGKSLGRTLEQLGRATA